MYETRQHKDKVSRRIDGSGKKQTTYSISKLQRHKNIVKSVLQREDWTRGVLEGNKTEVNWKTKSFEGDTVGVEMTATLGPEHKQGGPPLYNAQKNIMKILPTDPRLPNKQKYVRGHLLNDNVGGPGEEKNLFPITGYANQEHERSIESDVKDWVNNKKQWVKYTVKVEDIEWKKVHANCKKAYVNCKFVCHAKIPNTKTYKYATIYSRYDQYAVPNIRRSQSYHFNKITHRENKYQPLWSKSKNTFRLNIDLLKSLSYGFNHSPTHLRVFVLGLDGVGSTTVNTLEKLFKKGISDYNSHCYDRSQKMAIRRLDKYNDLLIKQIKKQYGYSSGRKS